MAGVGLAPVMIGLDEVGGTFIAIPGGEVEEMLTPGHCMNDKRLGCCFSHAGSYGAGFPNPYFK